MAEVLEEITHLTPKDCYFIVERHKRTFDYPIHQHAECELNFVENAKGVKRIVGSSIEEIGEYDLALINSPKLPHVWDQGNCPPKQIREITIHFSPDLLGDSLMSRNQFASIKEMLERAKHGLAFPTSAIMKVYNYLDGLASEKDSFKQFMHFTQILYELSRSKYHELDVTAHPERPETTAEDPRIASVKDYVASRYNEDITLETLSDIAGMTPTAFSRYFKLHTGRTVSNYIIETRLGAASRALVDTSQTISEICYNCGFNNLSNFNRTFKSKRGVTPRDFRMNYKKKKVLV
ncbi:MAG: helix-turn-helix domain-containing protein [Bacteroidales bacterium]|nr:helix-turn-helix domain-containing protein [Bacteroidales bacterium]